MERSVSPTAQPPLAHTRVAAPGGEPAHWLFVLHGIYGRGRNWGTIARRLAESRPEWGAVLVDLRHHGDSVAPDPDHTLEAVANDIHQLATHLGVTPVAILGHSFGGKVALLYAQAAPSGLRQVWVVDSTPAAREPSGSAWGMIEAVRGMPSEFASRAEFVERLAGHNYPAPVGQWMAMNLEPVEGGRYRWRLDFAAMEAMLREFFRTDLLPMLDAPPAGIELHFVRATESVVLGADVQAQIESAARANGRVFLHHLPGGHWINTDNPQGVIELLQTHLP